MGLDHPSGPGKGPETVDKPTTQGNGDTPPAGSTGSSGESSTPRADSLRAAGWKLKGNGETGTDQGDDRDQQTGESSSAGSTGDKQRGPGDPPAEADPKNGKEPETGPGVTDPSRTRDNGQQPESPAGRTEPPQDQPQPGTSKADAGPADSAAPRSTAPNGDIDDRRPAGEATAQNGHDSRTHSQTIEPQQAETAGRSSDSTGEHDGKNANPQTENVGGEPAIIDKSEPQQPTGTPPADDPATTQPPSRIESLRASGWQSLELPDHQPPPAETTDAAPRTEQPREQDDQALPQHEARPPQTDDHTPEHPPTDGQAPPSESSDHGRPPQPEQAEPTGPQPDAEPPETDRARPSPASLDKAAPAEQGPQAADGPPGNGPQSHDDRTGENTQQPADPPEGRADGATGEARTGERDAEPVGTSEEKPQTPDGQPPADDQSTLPRSPEQPPAEPDAHGTADESSRPQEPEGREQEPPPEGKGEHDDDHGKNAENNGAAQYPNETDKTNLEATEPPDESSPPSPDSEQSGEREEPPGRELAPYEDNPAETEPSRFNGRVTIAVDSDGRPLLPDRDPVEAEVGTRGRGEFGSPENDPADRDPREEDPERSSRRREVYRGIVDKPGDAKKSIDTFAEPAQRGIERVLPTGQHTGSRGSMDQFKSPDHTAKAGDALLGAASVVILAYEGARRGVNWVRQKIGRHHGDNR